MEGSGTVDVGYEGEENMLDALRGEKDGGRHGVYR